LIDGCFQSESHLRLPRRSFGEGGQSPKAFGVNFCCPRELRHESPISDHQSPITSTHRSAHRKSPSRSGNWWACAGAKGV